MPENAPTTMEQDYLRINATRSVGAMQHGLLQLAPKRRREVIVYALEKSEYQFTWSFLALQFDIPEDEWPRRSETTRR